MILAMEMQVFWKTRISEGAPAALRDRKGPRGLQVGILHFSQDNEGFFTVCGSSIVT